MTKPSRDANIGWLGFVLAALFVALVTLFGAGNPSAAAAPWAQTRVGAFSPEAQVVVGTHDGIDVGQGVRNSPPTDDSALAAGVAAVNPVAATPRPALEYGYDGIAPVYDASVPCVDVRTVVQVGAVGRHATAVSLRGQSGAASEASVGVSGFVVAAKSGSGRLSTVLKSGDRGAIGRGLSPNQMNRAINRGQGPSGITRIDTPKIPHEKLHATFEDGSALNVDGTWKHGGLDLTRRQSSWLVENGWTLP